MQRSSSASSMAAAVKAGVAHTVILATNIAESSVTIPDVDVVLDTCLTNQARGATM